MAEQQHKYEGILAETVRYPGHQGETVGGYLARPLGSGPYPGVVMIHEGFGLLPALKERAHKLAAAGYAALAVDLYWREGYHNPGPPGTAPAPRIPDERALGDLTGAAAALEALPACSGRLGCIGYCLGGRLTLLFASHRSSLAAAVSCYGTVGTIGAPGDQLSTLQIVENVSCPTLHLYGEADQYISVDQMVALEEELKRHNKNYEFKVYPGNIRHGFFDPYRPNYQQTEAADGWERIFSFFETHLKAAQSVA